MREMWGVIVENEKEKRGEGCCIVFIASWPGEVGESHGHSIVRLPRMMTMKAS